MVKICEVVDGCEDCPKYGDDCDGDKRTETTDYISRADAIDACCRGWNNTVEDCIRNIKEIPSAWYRGMECAQDIISALPSAELPKGELVSRADAIDAVAQQWLFEASVGNPYVNDDDIGEYRKLAEELFEDVPSADAVQETVPTVVRVTMSDGSQYYLEHERDAIQADAVQGEWKIDEYGIYHCPFCHAINNTVYKSFCPNCGARMKGGAE